eukprot:937692-Pyramimonas_sp.AAC.1
MSVIGEVICLTCLTHEHIDTMLKKYDMDDDRELNFGELKALMVDLVSNAPRQGAGRLFERCGN